MPPGGMALLEVREETSASAGCTRCEMSTSTSTGACHRPDRPTGAGNPTFNAITGLSGDVRGKVILDG